MFTGKQLFIVLVSGVLAAPAVTHAQALTKAIALHDSAVALYSQPDRASEAAELHMREANFRTAADPEAVTAIIMAGRLYAYANRPFAAKKAFEKAAMRALQTGAVFEAAESYLDAAFVVKESNAREAGRLARKAYLLSKSPLLASAQRVAIQRRIDSNSVLAHAAK